MSHNTDYGLIQSYLAGIREKDPALWKALNQLTDIVSDIDHRSPTDFNWQTLQQITNNIAADFIAPGATWNVVGTATTIRRSYSVTEDQRLMFYSWRIHACTLSAAVPEVRVALPPGYLVAGLGALPNDMYCGGGHHVIGGAVEAAMTIAEDVAAVNNVVRIFRQTSVNFPSPATFSTRGSILMAVERSPNGD